MKRLTRALKAGAVTLTGILLFLNPLNAKAVEQDSSPFIASNSISIAPEEYSGAFAYSYPFTIPPGRNGLQPSLSLSYNSGDSSLDNIAGYGWTLGVPSIQRLSKRGTDDLYNRHDFTSSLSGELEDISLSDSLHGTYGAKVDDGSYLTYTYNTDDTWTVIDKRGTEYTFGADTDSQVYDPGDVTHIFRWNLSKILDKNNNNVLYDYSKSGNQSYLDDIFYTGTGTSAGIFNVAFTYESRDDDYESFNAGYSVSTEKRVSDIDVIVDAFTVRNYAFAYTAGDNSTRSLLSSVTETGYDETSGTVTKPVTEFSYRTADRSWTEDTGFSFPLPIGNNGSSSLGVYVFDVNGDGLPDIVRSTTTYNEVYINNGDTTWTIDTGYTVPISFLSSIGKDRGVRVADMNGDGYQDIIQARTNAIGGLDDAVVSNNVGGLGRTITNDTYFNAGQAVGDAASMVQGVVEIAEGLAAGAGGVAISGTGAGALVGAPVTAEAVVITAHGAATLTAGAYHLSQSGGSGAPKAEDLHGKSPQEIDSMMKDKGWTGEPTRKGDGTRYPNPNAPGEQVRVQQGNPKDPNPIKQGPYGRISSDGQKTEPIPLKGNPTLNP
jgi:hypothetical protein